MLRNKHVYEVFLLLIGVNFALIWIISSLEVVSHAFRVQLGVVFCVEVLILSQRITQVGDSWLVFTREVK